MTARLAPLGIPPGDWRARLKRQNQRLVTFRNDLQHAGRFDLLPPSDRREAVSLHGTQLDDLKTWWPGHPYLKQEPLLEENPLRAAIQMLSRDERSAVALVERLGFTRIANPTLLNPPGDPSQLAAAVGDDVGRLYRVGQKSPGGGSVGIYLAYLKEWPPRSAARERYRRRLARALVQDRRDVRFLLIMANDQGDGVDRQGDEVEIVYPRQRANRPFGTVRAVINLARPTRYHLDLLRELDISRANSVAEIAKKWNEAFNVEKVTNAFYKEFQGLRNALAEALIAGNRSHPILGQWTLADFTTAAPNPRQRELQLNVTAFATRQLSRLLFLWFLQQKGWLGEETIPGPRTFLVDLFRKRPKTGDTYFSAVLTPLFFDGLGEHAHHERHRAAEDRLGGVRIPYLDGGLFRADGDPFECALFGVDIHGDNARTLTVTLPDALFDPALDNPDLPTGRRGQARRRTILGLLRSYRFTTQESTPDDQSVDPDPELLGKVLENLYQETDRHETGAYYTPREIVRHMCREALDGHLRDTAGVGQATLDRLREEAVDWQATSLRLSPRDESALNEALDEMTVVDPAVGSGAFLVGMLQETVLLRRGIASAATDRDVDRTSDAVYRWKRRAITHSLFGVDINPNAVEICRLRLWLSLVIEYGVVRIQDIPALPNLEFRVVAGDSLIDRMGETPFIHSLGNPNVQPDLEIDPHFRTLNGLVQKYNEADERARVARIRTLGAEIRDEQLTIARLQLDRVVHDAGTVLKRVQGAARPTQTALTQATRRVAAMTALRDGLTPNAPFLRPLLWPLVFPRVFEEGGFDIVVANPPYVRQESLEGVGQETYKAAFPDAFHGMADLYTFFFARAVQLLKPGGRLAFITSNKYMRANYGAPIRAHLPARLQIEQVIDFGDLPVFSVAAYPAVLVGRKTAEPDLRLQVAVADLTIPIRRQLRAEGLTVNLENVRGALEDVPGLVRAAKAADYPQALLRGSGWILEDPVLIRLFDRLMNEGTPLGKYVHGRIYYGIKTGFNEAFVIDEATRAALVAADPRSAELIKPWLRGRDIKRWKPEWAGLYVIAIQNSGDRDAANPWAAAPSEAAARAIFAKAYPAIHAHLSRYEAQLPPPRRPGPVLVGTAGVHVLLGFLETEDLLA